MLNAFIDWAREIAGKPLGKDVEGRVTKSQASDNLSARLDVDTPTAVARITFWESGDYDAEAIDMETERTIFSDHGHFREDWVFSEQFSAFFKSLGITIE